MKRTIAPVLIGVMVIAVSFVTPPAPAGDKKAQPIKGENNEPNHHE
jgi:hypothetical protein